MKHPDQKQLREERIYLAYTSRNPKAEFTEEHCLLTQSLPSAYLAFLMQSRILCPGIVLPSVG